MSSPDRPQDRGSSSGGPGRAPAAPARLPKLCGADVELGNFIQGLDRPGGTSYEASRALLREIPGIRAASAGSSASCGCARCLRASGLASSIGYGTRLVRTSHDPDTRCSSGPGRDDRETSGQFQDWGRRFLPGQRRLLLHRSEPPGDLRAGGAIGLRSRGRLARDAPRRARRHDRRQSSPARRPATACGGQQQRRAGALLREPPELPGDPNLLGRDVPRQAPALALPGRLPGLKHRADRPGKGRERERRAAGASTSSPSGPTSSSSSPACRRPSRARSSTPATSRSAAGAASPAGRPPEPIRPQMARLHVIFYDSNLCQVAALLKVGMMQIVLAMIEAGCVDRTLLLESPLLALRRWSHDPELRACARPGADRTSRPWSCSSGFTRRRTASRARRV